MLELKPKLLLLAYYFRPSQAIASSRLWNMAIQLAKSGWDVTVLMPRRDQWQRPEPDASRLQEEADENGLRFVEVDVSWPMLTNDLRWRKGRLGWLVGGGGPPTRASRGG